MARGCRVSHHLGKWMLNIQRTSFSCLQSTATPNLYWTASYISRDKHDWYGKISRVFVSTGSHMFVLEVKVQYTCNVIMWSKYGIWLVAPGFWHCHNSIYAKSPDPLSGGLKSVPCETRMSLLFITYMQMCRYGQCLTYTRERLNRDNPCDAFYEIDVDRVFLPSGRARDNFPLLLSFAADVNIIKDIIEEPCRYMHLSCIIS